VHGRRDARRPGFAVALLGLGHVHAVQDGVHLEANVNITVLAIFNPRLFSTFVR
jgi:hypothetical protein